MLKPLLIRAAILAARPFYRGIGAVHVLHRVVPEEELSRLPDNRALEITPRDLDAVLCWMKARRHEFVALDDLPARLRRRDGRKFVCFTFDDGYRDNLLHALPVFEKHGVPFTVNITTAFSDHRAIVWWYALEKLVMPGEPLVFELGGRRHEFATATMPEKSRAFEAVARIIRGGDLAHHQRAMEAVFAGASFDPLDCARQLVMDWDEVARLAAHPLAAIGAHGLHHLTSRQLDDDALREEFAGSKRIIEERIGRPVRHLAYPFGGAQAVGGREFRIARECGFVTAATTRCANLFPAHADALDRLPRLCISGNYPVITCLERLESGFTAAFANGWKRVVTE